MSQGDEKEGRGIFVHQEQQPRYADARKYIVACFQQESSTSDYLALVFLAVDSIQEFVHAQLYKCYVF